MTRAQTKPDTTRPEQHSDPLINQDYGTADWLDILRGSVNMPNVRVTHLVKVEAGGRLVVEFQAVKLDGVPARPFGQGAAT